ncbi:hypothetical protein, partial [Thiolapillus sp.]|uniref:hypothetical protein n=1 Tax=Thiolapillus sp. TaxID=2017437 RepID=UPI003AF54011
MTRTAGAQIGCQRPSRFWGLGCPKIYHEVEDTLEYFIGMVLFPVFQVMHLAHVSSVIHLVICLSIAPDMQLVL